MDFPTIYTLQSVRCLLGLEINPWSENSPTGVLQKSFLRLVSVFVSGRSSALQIVWDTDGHKVNRIPPMVGTPDRPHETRVEKETLRIAVVTSLAI